MKKIRKIAMVCAVTLTAILPAKLQAKSVGLNTTLLLGMSGKGVVVTGETTKPLDLQSISDKNATTVSSIQFADGEFLRITQPKIKEGMSTFEEQLALMIEARVNTNITIKVLYGDKSLKQTSTTYESKVVGASQTFSQVLDLQVGENTVIVSATHEEKEEIADLSFLVTRKSEEAKEALINYNVQQSSLLNTNSK